MPRQTLDAADATQLSDDEIGPGEPLKRAQWGMLLAAAMIGGVEGALLFLALGRVGLTPLGVALIAVSAWLTAWIAFGFGIALVGLKAAWRAPPAPVSLDRPSGPGRVALLLAAYEEDPGLVFGAAEALSAELLRLGAERRFDIFVLSDTRDATAARNELASFLRLKARAPAMPGLHYRRRAQNTDRKAGNIAEWVETHGGGYAYMVTLDADSLMSAETLLALTAGMDADPNLGLLQTVPTLLNAHTVFARVQQFAARLYGPVFAHGLARWAGDAGNYYGHNAIIRVAAFASSAGLPHLPGPRPWGGHILSHDFVEAALLRRRGWGVRLAPHLGGSFEEAPPTLIDSALRDRRWCQGNLQHLRLLGAPGLHPLSRLHLLFGALAYLAAPFWLVLLVLGAVVWPSRALAVGGMARVAMLVALGLNLALLIGPKLMGLALALKRGEGRSWPGGARALIAGVGLETVLSFLLTPVSLVMQSMSIFDVVIGRDSGWRPQRRDTPGLTWRDVWRVHRGHVVLGVLGAAGALALDRALLVWAGPVFLSLALSSVLSLLTSRPAREADGQAGVLATPDEVAQPTVARVAQAHRAAYAAEAALRDEIDRLFRDPTPVYEIQAPGLAEFARRRAA